MLTVLIVVAFGILNDWTVALIGAATLAFSFSPYWFARRLGVELPISFQALTVMFAFASIFLGEVFEFYERIGWWDLFLHGAAGIGFGLVGFLLVFILFQGRKYAAPRLATSGMAFVFAVSIGTFWELFEFGMDEILGKTMQMTGRDDTMTDVLMNTSGAAVGSSFAYAYLLGDRSGLPSRMIHAFMRKNRHLFGKSTRSKNHQN